MITNAADKIRVQLLLQRSLVHNLIYITVVSRFIFVLTSVVVQYQQHKASEETRKSNLFDCAPEPHILPQ